MQEKTSTFEQCHKAKQQLNKDHEELIGISHHQEISHGGKNGWTNSTMTDQTVAQYFALCQRDGGRFVAVESAQIVCSQTKTMYRNVGDCFPNITACADYSLATFLVWVFNNKLHALSQCKVVSEVPLDTIPELVPSTAPSSESPTSSPLPTIFHSDSVRMKCTREMNDFCNDNDAPVEDLASDAITSTSREWQNTTYELSWAKGEELRCQQAGGRNVSFTAILDCRGLDEYTNDHKKAYRNAVTCFPPTGACDSYISGSDWWIDFNYVWHYACTLWDNSAVPVAPSPPNVTQQPFATATIPTQQPSAVTTIPTQAPLLGVTNPAEAGVTSNPAISKQSSAPSTIGFLFVATFCGALVALLVSRRSRRSGGRFESLVELGDLSLTEEAGSRVRIPDIA